MQRQLLAKEVYYPNNTIIVFYKIIRYTMINSYSGFFMEALMDRTLKLPVGIDNFEKYENRAFII